MIYGPPGKGKLRHIITRDVRGRFCKNPHRVPVAPLDPTDLYGFPIASEANRAEDDKINKMLFGRFIAGGGVFIDDRDGKVRRLLNKRRMKVLKPGEKP